MAKAAMEEKVLLAARQGIPTVVVVPTEFLVRMISVQPVEHRFS